MLVQNTKPRTYTNGSKSDPFVLQFPQPLRSINSAHIHLELSTLNTMLKVWSDYETLPVHIFDHNSLNTWLFWHIFGTFASRGRKSIPALIPIATHTLDLCGLKPCHSLQQACWSMDIFYGCQLEPLVAGQDICQLACLEHRYILFLLLDRLIVGGTYMLAGILKVGVYYPPIGWTAHMVAHNLSWHAWSTHDNI